MFRAIIFVLLVATVSPPAQATYDWGYKCNARDAQIALELEVVFNSSGGGNLTVAKGRLSVTGGPQDKFSLNAVSQSWTSARNFNIAIGEVMASPYVLTVETTCGPQDSENQHACTGRYLVTWDLAKYKREGRIACRSIR